MVVRRGELLAAPVFLDLFEGADGVVDDGAFAIDELEVEAHGGEGEEEVGEDDGGVDAEAFGGGDGDFGGDGGGAADVEEGVVLADGHVLRHVATGLTEEPDGSAVYGLAEAGTDEAARGGWKRRRTRQGCVGQKKRSPYRA